MWNDYNVQFHCTGIICNDLVPVLRATIGVNDWYTLGLELGLPVYQLDKIRRDGYDETDRKQKMIIKWLDTGRASWSSLVKALKSPLIDKGGSCRTDYQRPSS